jgi:cytochrome c-type biogenesis protein CcmH/NrfG
VTWLTRIKVWLLVAAAGLLALLGAWVKGRQGGKAAARLEAQEDALEQATETNKIVQEVRDEVRQAPAGGSADRLKREWLRRK